MCVAAEIMRPQISSPSFSVAADHNTSSIPFFIVLSGHPSKAAGPPQVPGMQCRSHSACWQFGSTVSHWCSLCSSVCVVQFV